jgi:hypothetical protein
MSFSSQVESWRSMAEATHFDASFPLAWIAIESDGEFPHKSSANERGPFEVSWPEANEILHLTRDDFDRIMDDRL